MSEPAATPSEPRALSAAIASPTPFRARVGEAALATSTRLVQRLAPDSARGRPGGLGALAFADNHVAPWLTGVERSAGMRLFGSYLGGGFAARSIPAVSWLMPRPWFQDELDWMAAARVAYDGSGDAEVATRAPNAAAEAWQQGGAVLEQVAPDVAGVPSVDAARRAWSPALTGAMRDAVDASRVTERIAADLPAAMGRGLAAMPAAMARAETPAARALALSTMAPSLALLEPLRDRATVDDLTFSAPASPGAVAPMADAPASWLAGPRDAAPASEAAGLPTATSPAAVVPSPTADAVTPSPRWTSEAPAVRAMQLLAITAARGESPASVAGPQLAMPAGLGAVVASQRLAQAMRSPVAAPIARSIEVASGAAPAFAAERAPDASPSAPLTSREDLGLAARGLAARGALAAVGDAQPAGLRHVAWSDRWLARMAGASPAALASFDGARGGVTPSARGGLAPTLVGLVLPGEVDAAEARDVDRAVGRDDVDAAATPKRTVPELAAAASTEPAMRSADVAPPTSRGARDTTASAGSDRGRVAPSSAPVLGDDAITPDDMLVAIAASRSRAPARRAEGRAPAPTTTDTAPSIVQGAAARAAAELDGASTSAPARVDGWVRAAPQAPGAGWSVALAASPMAALLPGLLSDGAAPVSVVSDPRALVPGVLARAYLAGQVAERATPSAVSAAGARWQVPAPVLLDSTWADAAVADDEGLGPSLAREPSERGVAGPGSLGRAATAPMELPTVTGHGAVRPATAGPGEGDATPATAAASAPGRRTHAVGVADPDVPDEALGAPPPGDARGMVATATGQITTGAGAASAEALAAAEAPAGTDTDTAVLLDASPAVPAARRSTLWSTVPNDEAAGPVFDGRPGVAGARASRWATDQMLAASDLSLDFLAPETILAARAYGLALPRVANAERLAQSGRIGALAGGLERILVMQLADAAERDGSERAAANDQADDDAAVGRAQSELRPVRIESQVAAGVGEPEAALVATAAVDGEALGDRTDPVRRQRAAGVVRGRGPMMPTPAVAVEPVALPRGAFLWPAAAAAALGLRADASPAATVAALELLAARGLVDLGAWPMVELTSARAAVGGGAAGAGMVGRWTDPRGGIAPVRSAAREFVRSPGEAEPDAIDGEAHDLDDADGGDGDGAAPRSSEREAGPGRGGGALSPVYLALAEASAGRSLLPSAARAMAFAAQAPEASARRTARERAQLAWSVLPSVYAGEPSIAADRETAGAAEAPGWIGDGGWTWPAAVGADDVAGDATPGVAPLARRAGAALRAYVEPLAERNADVDAMAPSDGTRRGAIDQPVVSTSSSSSSSSAAERRPEGTAELVQPARGARHGGGEVEIPGWFERAARKMFEDGGAGTDVSVADLTLVSVAPERHLAASSKAGAVSSHSTSAAPPPKATAAPPDVERIARDVYEQFLSLLDVARWRSQGER